MTWVIGACVIGGFGTFIVCLALMDRELGKFIEHNRKLIEACKKLGAKE